MTTGRNQQKHTVERLGSAEHIFPAQPVVPYRAGVISLAPGKLSASVEPGLDAYELIWCTSGTLILPILPARRTLVLHPGEAVFRSPGTPRTGRAEGRIPAEYRFLCFHGPHAAEFFNAYEIPLDTPFAAGACPVAVFDELETLILLNTPYALRRCVALIATLFAEMLPDKEQAEDDQLLNRALSKILALYPDKHLNVQTLANGLHVHRTTLQRLFIQRLGLPPHRYLLGLRLRKARMLIESSGLPIAEVAAATGFARPNYFCSCFTRHYAVTPGQLRSQRPVPKTQAQTEPSGLESR